MRFSYAESFRATVGSLSPAEGERLRKAMAKFEAAWQERRFPSGLGMAHLRASFYEFRVDIHCRVLFQRQRDSILYLLYGSHDSIRRFLKTI